MIAMLTLHRNRLIQKLICSIVVMIGASVAAVAQDEILKSYLQAGMLAFQQGNYSKAETLFKAAIAELENTSLSSEKKTSGLIIALNGLGLALTNQEKHVEAEAVTRRQIAIMEQANKANDADFAIALNNLGLMLANQGKLTQASEVHRRALAWREKHLGPAHPEVAFSLLNLGKVYFDDNKFDQAEAVFIRAVSIIGAIPTESQTDENMLALAICDMNLSSIKVGQRKFAEAEDLLLVAILIRTKIQGPTHPDLIEPLQNYLTLLRQMNRNKDAADIEVRIRRIKSENR